MRAWTHTASRCTPQPDENGNVRSRVIFQGLPPIINVEDGWVGWVRILALPVILIICFPLLHISKQLVRG